MTVPIRHQLWHGDEADTCDARSTSIEAQACNEHVSARGSSTHDIADSRDDIGEKDKISSTEEIRVRAKEEDGDRSRDRDTRDDPSRELSASKAREELRRDGAGDWCGPERRAKGECQKLSR